MKKLLISIVTAASMLMGTVGAYAATNSSLKISNGEKSVTYRYSADSKSETISNVSELFDKMSELTDNNREIVQELKLTAGSTDSAEVDMVLILTDGNEAQGSKEKSPVALYNVEVTDSDGSVISKIDAGAEDIEINNTGKYIKNISFGRFHSESAIEAKSYKVKISVGDNVSKSDIELAKANTKWFVKGITENSAVSDPTAEPTSATETKASPSASPEASEQPKEAVKGTKLVGKDKDIVPGKYVMTGNGEVKIYNSKGTVKADIVLKDGKSEAKENAVESYAIELEEGDKVEIYDRISLKPYEQKAAATAAPRSTAKPAATTAAKKTNPKTADNAPIAAVAVVAVAALGAVAYLEYSKRKKN